MVWLWIALGVGALIALAWWGLLFVEKLVAEQQRNPPKNWPKP